jgi:hypothetical protein
MIARLISTWRPAAKPREAASEPATDMPGSRSTSREHEERYLLATAESMLRAGYGHKEIERALSRMSPDVGGDSGRRAGFRSLRASLVWRGRTSRRRSTEPVSASSK